MQWESIIFPILRFLIVFLASVSQPVMKSVCFSQGEERHSRARLSIWWMMAGSFHGKRYLVFTALRVVVASIMLSGAGGDSCI